MDLPRREFGNDVADQLKAGADDFIKTAENEGVDVNNDGNPVTIEQMTQNMMATEKVLDLNQDGRTRQLHNDGIPILTEQAATQMTDWCC